MSRKEGGSRARSSFLLLMALPSFFPLFSSSLISTHHPAISQHSHHVSHRFRTFSAHRSRVSQAAAATRLSAIFLLRGTLPSSLGRSSRDEAEP